jgi:hypothetical protein
MCGSPGNADSQKEMTLWSPSCRRKTVRWILNTALGVHVGNSRLSNGGHLTSSTALPDNDLRRDRYARRCPVGLEHAIRTCRRARVRWARVAWPSAGVGMARQPGLGRPEAARRQVIRRWAPRSARRHP